MIHIKRSIFRKYFSKTWEQTNLWNMAFLKNYKKTLPVYYNTGANKFKLVLTIPVSLVIIWSPVKYYQTPTIIQPVCLDLWTQVLETLRALEMKHIQVFSVSKKSEKMDSYQEHFPNFKMVHRISN